MYSSESNLQERSEESEHASNQSAHAVADQDTPRFGPKVGAVLRASALRPGESLPFR